MPVRKEAGSKTSVQLDNGTYKRLQCYVVLKEGNPYHQSKVINQAIEAFLDSVGFPKVKDLPSP